MSNQTGDANAENDHGRRSGRLALALFRAGACADAAGLRAGLRPKPDAWRSADLHGRMRAFGVLAAILLFPAGASAAIAFRAASANTTYSTATTLTLAAPAGTVATDILIAVVGSTGASRSSTCAATAPAGWTAVKSQQDATNFGDLNTFWALGSVASFAFTITNGGNCGGSGFVLGYTGVNTTTPMDATAVGQTNAAGTVETAPTITTVTANAQIVGLYLWFVTGAVALPTYSAEFGTHRLNGGLSGGRAGSSSVDTADLVQAVAGASGAKTVTASSSQKSLGILVALRPGAAAAATTPLRTLIGVGN